MPAITKPTDLNKIWAQSGDVLAPSDSKISQGWAVEIPPRQYFNYIDNKQDQAIAHFNQAGIAIWDSFTEYQANASYCQGNNGIIYKCQITNTNVNPVGDNSGTWKVAFVDSAAAPIPSTSAQSQAFTNNTAYITPLQLAQAFMGTNQSLASNGYQKLPNGVLIQWGNSSPTSLSSSVIFPISFPNQVFRILTQDSNPADIAELTIFTPTVITTSGFNAQNVCRLTRGTTTVGATTPSSCQWLAIGN